MYQIQYLDKENDLNRILRQSKREGGSTFKILYISLWDRWCKQLVADLDAAYGENEEGEIIYVADSFNMPHSFMVHNVTRTPTLVSIGNASVQAEDYLPMIRRILLREKSSRG